MSIEDDQRREGLARELFGPEPDLVETVAGWTSFIDADGEQHTRTQKMEEFIESLDWLSYRAANPSFQDTVDDVLGEVRDLIVDRQRTYGPSNIEQQGIFGIINRIGNDKLARIRQRLHGRIENGEILLDDIELGSVDQPGIINDLADVIGYAVCGMLLLRGEWGMPLAEEFE